MPLTPSIGIYLPGNGYVNGQNSPFSSGTGDPVTGLSNYQGGGLTPGRIIELSDTEAAALAVPGSTLYGGYYQWVQLDAAAVAANLKQGQLLFWKASLLNSGNPVVTDVEAGNTALIAGAIVNPLANIPTPGNWFLMFIGNGRVQLLCDAAFTGTGAAAIGDPICAKLGGNNGTVDDFGTATPAAYAYRFIQTYLGNAETVPAVNTLCTIEWVRTFVRS